MRRYFRICTESVFCKVAWPSTWAARLQCPHTFEHPTRPTSTFLPHPEELHAPQTSFSGEPLWPSPPPPPSPPSKPPPQPPSRRTIRPQDSASSDISPSP